jgi:hypothetical protein
MEDSVDFEILYNENSLEEVSDLRWKLAYDIEIWRTRLWLILGFLLVLFGVCVLPFDYGYIMIGAGLCMMLFAGNIFSQFRKAKTKFYNEVRKMIDNPERLRYRFALDEDFLEAESSEKISKLKWSAIKYCHLENDILFIVTGEKKSDSIILRQNDMDSSTFTLVVNFVKRKCTFSEKR